MNKVAIMTDSNSGITQDGGKELGVFVLPMPFTIDNETFYEDISLTQEGFYEYLAKDADVATSQPTPADVIEMFRSILKEYDEIVYIPMSSGLSGSCQTAAILASEDEFDGKVFVVDNQRISVTQRQSVLDAQLLAKEGKSGKEIQDFLIEDKFNSSIYIMLNTLYYLKKGGRITPAAAALGTLLKLKPVLQIQGEKLDAFAKARTVVQGKKLMIAAIKKDIETRFGGLNEESKNRVTLHIAYSKDEEAANIWKEEVMKEFEGYQIHMDPLSLSVSCHIGDGALALAVTQNIR